MSLSAVHMRQNGHTWDEIAEYLQFVDGDGARTSATGAARAVGTDLATLRLDED